MKIFDVFLPLDPEPLDPDKPYTFEEMTGLPFFTEVADEETN